MSANLSITRPAAPKPARARGVDTKFTKLVVFVNASVPVAMLLWDAARGNLGANPAEYLTRTSGMLALVFLTLAIAVTPLRRLTGAQWIGAHRKMVGLFGFFYVSVHLLTYVWFDKVFDVPEIVADTFKRPFIFFGMAAFLMLVPLAITSTNGMIKRLGGKNWRLLHRLVFPAALAGAFHYYLLVKADVALPIAFAVAIAVLIVYRLVPTKRSPAKLAPQKKV